MSGVASSARLLEVASVDVLHWFRSPHPLLIRGERGTGKSVLARRVHAESGRAGDLVTLPMSHLPEAQQVVVMTGATRGAYPGLDRERKGAFARAHRGTLLLDELGLASLEAQGTLLPILDTGRLTPLAANCELVVDVRVIGATNADLEWQVERGTFLQDLLDRFGYFQINLLALRDRRGDILPSVASHLEAASATFGRAAPALSPSLKRALLKAPWRGNLRQVQNVARYLAVNAGATASVGDLPRQFLAECGLEDGGPEPLSERARRVLADCLGNKAEAARHLRISRGHLYRVLKQER